MSINLKLSKDSQKLESKLVQLLPCRIEYNGDAKVDKYFNVYSSKNQSQTNEDGDIKPEPTTLLESSFRGHPLNGQTIAVPSGFTGVTLKESRPQINDEEERFLKQVGQFSEFTFWNWDRNPSRSDKYQHAIDWIDIAKIVHGIDE